MTFKYPNNHLMKYILASLISFLLSANSQAMDSSAIEQQARETINALYHTAKRLQINTTVNRIDWFSAQFKGKPYLLGALGEGPSARYDQYPGYRMDAFDCETYVTTILALVKANSLSEFQRQLRQIRYKDGQVDYISRNHFTSLDWNQNNQKNGLLTDITLTIKDKNNNSVALWAEALIDKSNWYTHLSASTIRLQQDNPTEQLKRLQELKNKGQQLGAMTAKIPYLPLSALFINKKQPNLELFSQIPHGAIIEIVRPNWDLRKSVGTALNVSHLGFAIRHNGQLFFRQASSQMKQVVDVPLIDYLRQAQNSPTIKGINVQIVN